MTLRTALIVETPEAEDAIGAYRMWNDPAAARGIPAHVTLLTPFKPPDAIDGRDFDFLSEYFASASSFAYTLTSFGRFEDGGILWLRPQPAGPFVALAQGLVARYPEYPPYGGAYDEIVPHVTIAHNLPEVRAFDGLEGAVGPFLPITCRADGATLMEEAADGMWSVRARFPFGGAP